MYYAQGSYRKKPAYNDNTKTRFQNRVCAYGTAAFSYIKIRHDLSPKAAVSIREVLRHPVHPLSLVIPRRHSSVTARFRSRRRGLSGSRGWGTSARSKVRSTLRHPSGRSTSPASGCSCPASSFHVFFLASACFYRYYTGKPTPAQPQTPKPVGSTSAGLSAFTHPASAAPAPTSPAPAFRCAIHSCG